MTQNNLAIILLNQAERIKGPEATRLFEKAVAACRDIMTVLTREEFPQDWARTQYNLARAFRDQADRKEGPEAVRLLEKAIQAGQESLKVITPSSDLHYYLIVTRFLRWAETALRERKQTGGEN